MKKIVTGYVAYFFLVFAILIAPGVFAGWIIANAAEFRVTKVSDGDTVYGCLKDDPVTGLNCFSVRVNNLNTPEKRLCKSREMDKANACERCQAGSTLGIRAKLHAEEIFRASPNVNLEVLNKDRYNRVVGNIRLADNSDYATVMIDLELGVRYPCKNGKCGARPRPWCPAI